MDGSPVMTWEMGERDNSREEPFDPGDASSGLAIRRPPNDWDRLKSPLIVALRYYLRNYVFVTSQEALKSPGQGRLMRASCRGRSAHFIEAAE